MDVRIRVTTEQLARAANDLERQINQAAGHMDVMMRLLDSTSAYWKGDAAEAMRNRGTMLKQDADDLFRRLRLRPGELQNMADTYARTEQENKTAVMSLPVPGLN